MPDVVAMIKRWPAPFRKNATYLDIPSRFVLPANRVGAITGRQIGIYRVNGEIPSLDSLGEPGIIKALNAHNEPSERPTPELLPCR